MFAGANLLITSQEFAANDRTVDDYVVPNAFTLSSSPFVSDRDTLSPEDMTDYNGHGTASHLLPAVSLRVLPPRLTSSSLS